MCVYVHTSVCVCVFNKHKDLKSSQSGLLNSQVVFIEQKHLKIGHNFSLFNC